MAKKKKKIMTSIKLQIPGGNATPAPPVGPALGQHGVNIMEFCKAFNSQTAKQPGVTIPVVLTVYADRSFDFITKTPPAAVLLKQAAGIAKASGEPNKTKVGKVSKAQVKEIAETKMEDLNAANIEMAMRMIEGTARSMGILIEGQEGEVADAEAIAASAAAAKAGAAPDAAAPDAAAATPAGEK